MLHKKGLYLTSFVLVCSGLLGCKVNPNSTGISQERVYENKWDKFADFVGLPHLSESPDLTDKKALTAALSIAPRNFQSHSDNAVQYKNVSDAVNAYVLGQAKNMQASSVVSIVPYAQVLAAADTADQGTGFVSLPYLERGAAQANAFSDLSDVKSNSGIGADSKFAVHTTVNGKVTSTVVRGTVYVLTYQLGGNKSQNHLALVSIPDGVLNGAGALQKSVPLMVFAHGGDSGLSFREMATLLQGSLGDFVVAAPVYPGENLCSVDAGQGGANTRFVRSCVDTTGQLTSPLLVSQGVRSPVNGDVNSLLGMHQAITKLAFNKVTGFYTGSQNIFVDSTGAPILKLHSEETNPPHDFKEFYGFQTVGVSDSRGGATLMSALGRAGIMIGGALQKLTNYLQTCQPDPRTHICPSIVNRLPMLPYFSGAGLYYTPSSFLVGQFRMLTQFMMSGVVPYDAWALPMMPELVHYFDAYRNAEVGSAAEDEELAKLVGQVAASDIAYLAPYLSLAVQNWTTNSLRLFYDQKVAPGSLLLLHGTQDKIVPFAESLIAKVGMDAVFDNIYRSNAAQSPLVAGFVPAVGTQFFSFQPDVAYYNQDINGTSCTGAKDAHGNDLTNYNPVKGKCFGGGYNGEPSLRPLTDHGRDPEFLTSRVVNYQMRYVNYFEPGTSNIDPSLQNALLYGLDPAWDDPNPAKVNYLYSFSRSHVVTALDQFSYANMALNSFAPSSVPYNLAPTCDVAHHVVGSGLCYLVNAESSDTFPLYNRPMIFDQTQSYSTMLTGVWDNAAQNATLTPTDIFSAWMKVSVLGDLGVLHLFVP